MQNLIKSLQIISKYMPFRGSPADPSRCLNQLYPTHCEHDVLMIPSINEEVWESVSEEDKERLDVLGWCMSEEYNCLISFRYGSC